MCRRRRRRRARVCPQHHLPWSPCTTVRFVSYPPQGYGPQGYQPYGSPPPGYGPYGYGPPSPALAFVTAIVFIVCGGVPPLPPLRRFGRPHRNAPLLVAINT